MSNALCINTARAPHAVLSAIAAYNCDPSFEYERGRFLLPIVDEEFNKQWTFMADRELCDSKREDMAEVTESMLQLLPYIPLVTYDDRIYLYSRGKNGGEDRLKANTSVGLGGHVDGLAPVGMTLLEWLRLEAQREVQEEVGMVVDVSKIDLSHFIVDRTNPVGRVHLGILAVVEVEDDSASSAELDIIENDGFVSLATLHNTPEMFQKLENWSQMVVKHLYETRFLSE